MLEWIKNNLENKAGLSDEKLSLLSEEFIALEKVDRELPVKVLTYILDGKGEDVLKMLESFEGCGKALKLQTFAINYTEEEGKEVFGETGVREKFFNSVECRDGSFYLRLARVYDSAFKRDRYVPGGQIYTPRPLEWLDNFLIFIGHETNLPVHIVEEMLSLAGESPDTIVRSVFFPSEYYMIRNIGSLLKGFRESVLRHKAVVLEALEKKDLNGKIEALHTVSRLNADLEPFLEKITEFALSSAKTLRTEAEKFLRARKEKAIPLLKAKALSGTAEERYYALKFLGTLAGKEMKEFFLEIKSKEKSKKISTLISELLSSLKDISSAGDPSVKIFPLPAINSISPLNENIRKELQSFFEEYNSRVKTICKKSGDQFEPFTDEKVNHIFFLLQNMKIEKKDYEPPFNMGYIDSSVIKNGRKRLYGRIFRDRHIIFTIKRPLSKLISYRLF